MIVSIAIATFNGQEFLRAQLESLAQQTRPPDEIVVSDDGSEDETFKIVDDFRLRVNFSVKFVKNRGLRGYCSNFSNALENCTGDVIFLCDQDDVWFESKIEVMLGFFDSNSVWPLVMSNELELTDSDLKPIGLTKSQILKCSRISELGHGLGCSLCLRGEFVRRCLPIPESVLAHDQWLNTCARLCDGYRFYPRVLQFYRRHDSSSSSFPDLLAGSKASRVVNRYRRFLKNFKQSASSRVYFKRHLLDWGIEAQKSGLLSIRGEKQLEKLRGYVDSRKLGPLGQILFIFRFHMSGGLRDLIEGRLVPDFFRDIASIWLVND